LDVELAGFLKASNDIYAITPEFIFEKQPELIDGSVVPVNVIFFNV
jgi:hypothetical protein